MKQTKQHGFTLVEILIVVVILGILASIVIPQFSSATAQSKAVAASSIVRTVQSKIFEDYATTGSYATTLDGDWFVEGALPSNPLAPEQQSPIVNYDTSAASGDTHPSNKLVGTGGAFWYNPNNGTFRALVPAQDTEALTLELYNAANTSDASTLASTSD